MFKTTRCGGVASAVSPSKTPSRRIGSATSPIVASTARSRHQVGAFFAARSRAMACRLRPRLPLGAAGVCRLPSVGPRRVAFAAHLQPALRADRRPRPGRGRTLRHRRRPSAQPQAHRHRARHRVFAGALLAARAALRSVGAGHDQSAWPRGTARVAGTARVGPRSSDRRARTSLRSRRAVQLGVWRLREVLNFATEGERVVQIDFLQTHPLIRDLSHYQLEP